MIALFLARIVVQKRIEAVLETLAPILTDNAPGLEARMAETSPNFILISRQGQPRICGGTL